MFVSLRNRLCVRKSGFQRQPRCGHFRNNLPFEMVPIPINLAKLVLKISKNDGKLLFYSGLPHVYHRSHQHPKSAQQTISQKRAQNRMNPGPHLKIGGFITVSRRNLLMLESVLNLGKTKLHHKQFYLNIYIYEDIGALPIPLKATHCRWNGGLRPEFVFYGANSFAPRESWRFSDEDRILTRNKQDYHQQIGCQTATKRIVSSKK